MAVQWSLLQPSNPAAALQAGFDRGQAMRQQIEVRGALSALANNPDDERARGALMAYAPEVAFKVEDRQRDARVRDLTARVFAPSAGGGALSGGAPMGSIPVGASAPVGALSVPPMASTPTPVGSMGQTPAAPMSSGMPAPAPAAAPGMGQPANILPASMAPTTLVDPDQLPRRSDGLQINKAALRDLYAADAPMALKIQNMVYDADKASAAAITRNGQQLASAAHHLLNIRNPDGTPDMAGRQREVAAMAPLLRQLGIPDENIATIDIGDDGLNRYASLYRSIGDLIKDDRADRRLEADITDDTWDNERADRNTDDVIGDRAGRRALTARGQNLTDARGRYGIGVSSADRQRGQDLSAGTTRRGQDMTDRRARDGVTRTGKGRLTAPKNPDSMVPGTAALPVTVTSLDQAKLLPKGTYFKNPQGKVMVR